MLSRIKLAEHGYNRILKSKIHETITMDSIINNINQEILRKYLNSFLFNGFSWLSSGQIKKIHTDAKRANIITAVLRLYNVDNLTNAKEIIIEKVVDISHLISVDA